MACTLSRLTLFCAIPSRPCLALRLDCPGQASGWGQRSDKLTPLYLASDNLKHLKSSIKCFKNAFWMVFPLGAV